MDKIEKIRQEIDRLYDDYKYKFKQHGDQYHLGLIDGLDMAERVLDTLSEEPDKGLEEEVKNYFQGYWPGTETAEQCNTDLHFTPLAILRLARHFAEWQAEKDKETIELSEDHAYFAGAVNEKEQMLKEAVEGYVCATYPAAQGNVIEYSVKYPKDKYPYKFGDKVRIIVCKKED